MILIHVCLLFFFLYPRCFASMPYGMTPTVPLVITIPASSITSWQMTQWRFGKSTREMMGETHSRYWWGASACPKYLWTRTVSLDWLTNPSVLKCHYFIVKKKKKVLQMVTKFFIFWETVARQQCQHLSVVIFTACFLYPFSLVNVKISLIHLFILLLPCP